MINVFINRLGVLRVAHKEHERNKATTYLVNGFNGVAVLIFVSTIQNKIWLTHMPGAPVFEANKLFKVAKALLFMPAKRLQCAAVLYHGRC